ncbi:MAG: methyltransferase domain-containing protein [Phycisphaerae bacterium]|nr:methyltransferase domain-containing protein [Phycisphaerae bacterium]
MSDHAQINSTNAIAAAWDNLADAYKVAVTDVNQRKPAVEIELAAFQQALPPGRLDILDAGCGVGSHGRKLLRRRHRITFADVSERMLQHAEELTPKTHRARAAFLQCDIRMLDTIADNSFDAVISGGTVITPQMCLFDSEKNFPLRNSSNPGKYTHGMRIFS